MCAALSSVIAVSSAAMDYALYSGLYVVFLPQWPPLRPMDRQRDNRNSEAEVFTIRCIPPLQRLSVPLPTTSDGVTWPSAAL